MPFSWKLPEFVTNTLQEELPPSQGLGDSNVRTANGVRTLRQIAGSCFRRRSTYVRDGIPFFECPAPLAHQVRDWIPDVCVRISGEMAIVFAAVPAYLVAPPSPTGGR